MIIREMLVANMICITGEKSLQGFCLSLKKNMLKLLLFWKFHLRGIILIVNQLIPLFYIRKRNLNVFYLICLICIKVNTNIHSQ